MAASPLERPQTLANAAAARIRDGIVHGEFSLGAALREGEISKSLGVATGTVREGFRILMSEGLVEIVPHRGAFVARLSVKDAQEIYTLRALLECYALRVALARGAFSEEDLDEMEEVVARMGEHERAGDTYELARADAEFHLLMCRRCGHKLILGVLQNLQSKMILYLLNIKLVGLELGREEASHRLILDSIRSGNAPHALRVVEEQINVFGARLLERMNATPDPVATASDVP